MPTSPESRLPLSCSTRPEPFPVNGYSNMDPSKACLYVGQSALCPRERFDQHRAGIRAARYVKKYGRWIRWKLFRRRSGWSRSCWQLLLMQIILLLMKM